MVGYAVLEIEVRSKNPRLCDGHMTLGVGTRKTLDKDRTMAERSVNLKTNCATPNLVK